MQMMWLIARPRNQVTFICFDKSFMYIFSSLGDVVGVQFKGIFGYLKILDEMISQMKKKNVPNWNKN